MVVQMVVYNTYSNMSCLFVFVFICCCLLRVSLWIVTSFKSHCLFCYALQRKGFIVRLCRPINLILRRLNTRSFAKSFWICPESATVYGSGYLCTIAKIFYVLSCFDFCQCITLENSRILIRSQFTYCHFIKASICNFGFKNNRDLPRPSKFAV